MHESCKGEWEAALTHARQAGQISQETGDLHSWGNAMGLIANVLNYRGDLTQAVPHCREIVRRAGEGADPQVQCWGLWTQGFAQRRLGQLDEAIAALQEAVELAKAIPDYGTHIAASGELGRCYLCRGELARARSVLEESQRVCAEHTSRWGNNIPLRNGLAEACLAAAEQSEATRRAERMKSARDACYDALKQGKTFRPGLPEAMRLRGTYEWLRGKRAAAQRWWQRSLALAEKMGQRYDLGMAYLEIGFRLGERAHLERAEAILAAIDAERDLARARGRLDAERGR
jgi:tetratricopeptide (TPR) repeat protein